MSKTILAISGKPGLYELVSRGKGSLIVENLLDHKRMPAFASDRVTSLADIAMYTDDEDMPLGNILIAQRELEGGKKASIDYKKASGKELNDYFAKFVPTFDRDRVHTSDIKKLIQWYNILIEAGINFEEDLKPTNGDNVEDREENEECRMKNNNREQEGLQLLGKKTEYRSDYAPEVLETFQNKHPENDYWVQFNCPEFTSLCPITGQPDFAEIKIMYIPDQKMVESKSLKLYLFSFRNHGDFHEDCVNIIMKDLIRLMDPKYIEVTGLFLPRGGISIYPYANYGRPGTKYEQMALHRLETKQTM